MKKSFLNLNNSLPGIVALFAFDPESAKLLNGLAEHLLRSDNSNLTRGERETIAAVVSRHNQTQFCYKSHRAFAEKNLTVEAGSTIDLSGVFQEGVSAIPDQKLRMLCRIALRTADNNAAEVAELSRKIIKNGLANEEEVHDAVLIASAFCMYNRYVKCLAAPVPTDGYAESAERIYEHGYCATEATVASEGV